MSTSHGQDDALWELLTRYAAGACTAEEARSISSRMQQEPQVADLLAEILNQGVALHEWTQAHPEPVSRQRIAPTHRWAAWAWPLAAAAVVTLVAVFLWKPATAPWTVQVVDASGSVQWIGQGEGKQSGGVVGSLTANAQLGGGTLETLSDDAAVTLAFRDGTKLTAMSHTVATISEEGQKRVHLRAGSLSAEVTPQPPGQPLLIHTATATLEVLGTRFDVESGENATRLQVSEGLVRVTRLVDGSIIDVPARHETVASLNRADRLSAVERAPVVVAWSSDLGQGAKGADGEWLPPSGEDRARLRAQPRILQSSSRGQVTIYRAGFEIPWEGLQTLQLQPEARARVRGRTTAPAEIEVMLSTKRLRGGFAGNYFQQITQPAGSWEIDLPVSAFRKERATGTEAPSEGLQLRHIAIYTIDQDAGLEIEQVEILHSGATGSSPTALPNP